MNTAIFNVCTDSMHHSVLEGEDLQRRKQTRRAELDTMVENLESYDAKIRIWTTFVLLVFEDVAELSIDLVFIFYYGHGIGDTTLFAISLALTAIHMIRVGADLGFQLWYRKNIPKILVLDGEKGNKGIQEQLGKFDKLSTCAGIISSFIDLSESTEQLKMFLKRQRNSLKHCM